MLLFALNVKRQKLLTKNSFSSITSFPLALEQKGAQSGTTTKALYHVRPRQSTVFGKSVLRNSTNSSSKCPFHQVTKRNPQMWLMAQMKACDMPMKKCISLCLPGQVDGHIVVLQHDEAGLWLFNFSELSLVKTTAALVVYLLNKSFKPYTRSKKSIVDFESRRGAGKKKKKTLRHHKLFWHRTFAERLLPIGHSPVRARFFPIRHLPITR